MKKLLFLSSIPLFIYISLAAGVPIIKNIIPTSANPGQKINIYGSNFDYTSQINFGGQKINPFSYTDTTLSFTVPGEAKSGVHSVQVIQGNSLSNTAEVTVTIPVLNQSITNISPSPAMAGDTAVIYGSNFDNSAYVLFDNQKLPAISKTGTWLKFNIPNNVTPGSHMVQVGLNNSPTSNIIFLTINDINPVPTISSSNPTYNIVPGQTVHLTGKNFDPSTYVLLEKVKIIPKYYSTENISFKVPENSKSGEYKVRVQKKDLIAKEDSYLTLNVIPESTLFSENTSPSFTNDLCIQILNTLRLGSKDKTEGGDVATLQKLLKEKVI